MNRATTATSTQTIEQFDRLRDPQLQTVPGLPACAAKAPTSGTPRAIAISTCFPAGAATFWAIRRRPSCGPIQEQVAELIHVPNTWYTEAQGEFAEAALHARASARPSSATAAPKRSKRRSSWPGCTAPRAATRSSRSKTAFTAGRCGAVTATAQPKYHEGLGPLVAGFRYAPLNDLEAVRASDRRRDMRHPARARARRRGHQYCRATISSSACGSWPTNTAAR